MQRYRVVVKKNKMEYATNCLKRDWSILLANLLCPKPHHGPTCVIGDAMVIKTALTNYNLVWGRDFYIQQIKHETQDPE